MPEYFHIHFKGMDYSETGKAQVAIDCKSGWECRRMTDGAGGWEEIAPSEAEEGSWEPECTDEIILSDRQKDVSLKIKVKEVLDAFLEKVQITELLVDVASLKDSDSQNRWAQMRICSWRKDKKGKTISVRFDGFAGVLSGEVSLPGIPVRFRVTLQIQSRMDICKDLKPGRPYFLSTLLLEEWAGINGDEHIPTSEDEVFDYLLLFWFREQFRAASRKGFYHTYQRRERNDDRLRGSIDFPRHLRLNLGLDNGRIAYSYRENTVDNPVNHLLVAAYEVLKRKYPVLVSDHFDTDLGLKNDMEFLAYRIGYGKYSIRECISMNWKPIGHPYYTEYERLRRTCLQILRDEEVSLFDGRLEEANGVLIYLPDLWENFLERRIRKQLSSKITLRSQDRILVFEKKNGQGRYFAQKTYPDYVFYEEDRPFMILDAKFEPKWKRAAFGSGGIRDVLEDYNKCLRDMVSINAHATGVLFPVGPDESMDRILFRHSVSERNQTDVFYTFPLRIPYTPRKAEAEAEGTSNLYSVWRKELDESLNSLLSSLCDYVEKERKRAKEMVGGFFGFTISDNAEPEPAKKN